MKKWYQSKKLWSVIVPMIVALIDAILFGITGKHLPTEAILSVAAAALGLIFVEGGLDAKSMALDKLKKLEPLQDPLIRDLVQSLIANNYDYRAATADLGLHSGQIAEKVITSLANMINPDLADSQEIRAEIAKQVVKQYDKDTQLMEGHSLAKVTTK